jgi:Zn-dependent protease with chaperone function
VNIWEFADLQERMAARAREHPGRFSHGVFWFVVLGYVSVGAYLGLILLIAALAILGIFFALGHPGYSVIASMVGIQLLGVLIFGILLRFVVHLVRRRPMTVGIPLSREEFPRVYQAAKTFSKRLGGPCVTKIKIYDEINAKARFEGILSLAGFGHAVLYLGAPLVAFLSEEQIDALIAHELAHFGAGHRRFGWLYAVRSPWAALADVVRNSKYFSKGGATRRLLCGVGSFVRWYFPRLEARYSAVSRTQEVVADANAVGLVDPRVYASLLIWVEVLYRLDTPFSRELTRQVRRTGVASTDVCRQRVERLSESLKELSTKPAVWLALGQESRVGDTHPMLMERLERIGIPADRRNAAVLNDLTNLVMTKCERKRWFVNDRLLEQLDAHLSESVAEHWATISAQMLQHSRRLRYLEAKRDQTTALAPNEAWERLQLIDLFGPEERYQREIVQFYEQNPASVAARLLSELSKLDNGESAAASVVEGCVTLATGFASFAAERLAAYYAKGLQFEDAQKWSDLHRELKNRSARLERERNVIRVQDNFVPAIFTEEARAAVVATFAQLKFVRRAYYVAKVLDNQANEKFDLIALRINSRWRFGSHRYQKERQQIADLSRTLPAPVVILERNLARLEPIFKRMRGAKLDIR